MDQVVVVLPYYCYNEKVPHSSWASLVSSPKATQNYRSLCTLLF